MDSPAYYALLGSLSLGAVGTAVLISVAVKCGFRRRPLDGDEAPEDLARRERNARLADTVALLCFAVSAGIGVLGLMHETRVVTSPRPQSDDAARLDLLDKRLARAELQLQLPAAPDSDTGGDRVSRFESRIDAVEERAALAAPPTPRPRAVGLTPSTSHETSIVRAVTSERAGKPLLGASPRRIPTAASQSRTSAAPGEQANGSTDDIPSSEAAPRDWAEAMRHAQRDADDGHEKWDYLQRRGD